MGPLKYAVYCFCGMESYQGHPCPLHASMVPILVPGTFPPNPPTSPLALKTPYTLSTATPCLHLLRHLFASYWREAVARSVDVSPQSEHNGSVSNVCLHLKQLLSTRLRDYILPLKQMVHWTVHTRSYLHVDSNSYCRIQGRSLSSIVRHSRFPAIK